MYWTCRTTGRLREKRKLKETTKKKGNSFSLKELNILDQTVNSCAFFSVPSRHKTLTRTYFILVLKRLYLSTAALIYSPDYYLIINVTISCFATLSQIFGLKSPHMREASCGLFRVKNGDVLR